MYTKILIFRSVCIQGDKEFDILKNSTDFFLSSDKNSTIVLKRFNLCMSTRDLEIDLVDLKLKTEEKLLSFEEWRFAQEKIIYQNLEFFQSHGSSTVAILIEGEAVKYQEGVPNSLIKQFVEFDKLMGLGL